MGLTENEHLVHGEVGSNKREAGVVETQEGVVTCWARRGCDQFPDVVLRGAESKHSAALSVLRVLVEVVIWTVHVLW